MSRITQWPALPLLLLLALPVSQAADPSFVVIHEHVPDELLVKFRSNTVSSRSMSLMTRSGVVDMRRFQTPQGAPQAAIGRWHRVKLAAGRSAKTTREDLMRDPNVEAVEFNHIVRSTRLPDDARFGELWGLNNLGQTAGTPNADINAPEAWDLATGGAGVVVAVIDSGIDYTHPDLAANLWTNPGEIPGNGADDDGNGYVDDVYGYDFYHHDADPMDDNGHGTHVAGTIAAVGNNGIGVTGVSWQARVMALKFLGPNGSGPVSGAIGAITYATNKGARIMNNSWGGSGFSLALQDAIAAANAANILFVASAGNSNGNNDVTPNYPSSYTLPNVLAVAATDHNDAKSWFSSYGAASVDLGAPGSNILSTVPVALYPSGYAFFNGTSMAAPHVSGAAALLLAQDGTRSPAALKTLIMNTATPVASLSGITQSGARLNVNEAINCTPSQLRLRITQPVGGFVTNLNEPRALRAALTTCTTSVSGAQLNATFSNGEPALALYDDGAHGDGAAGDGVYGNTWTPATSGAVTLTVSASHASFTGDTRSVDGQVHERIRYQVAPAAFAWVDATNGTRYPLTDESSVTIPIGFSFLFYGATFANVTISSNGFVTFNGHPGITILNAAIPNTASPNNYIAPLWDDLNPNPAAAGAVYSRLDGVAPDRQLTVSWIDVPHFSYGGAVSFQVILREGSDDILVQYQDVVFGNVPDYGASATVGIENADGTDGTSYSFNQARLANASSLRFYRASANSAPVANPGGSYDGVRGQALTLDGSASFDPEGMQLTYRWNFGDGATGSGVKPTHVYAAQGTYIVTLIVNDGAQDSAAITTTVTIPNRSPVANAGGPYYGSAGQALRFDGALSLDPDGDALSYRWNFGDGASGSGISPTHEYAAAGTYTVMLVTNDGTTDSPVATAIVSIDGPAASGGAGSGSGGGGGGGGCRLNRDGAVDPLLPLLAVAAIAVLWRRRRRV